jgi:hypothetical protein
MAFCRIRRRRSSMTRLASMRRAQAHTEGIRRATTDNVVSSSHHTLLATKITSTEVKVGVLAVKKKIQTIGTPDRIRGASSSKVPKTSSKKPKTSSKNNVSITPTATEKELIRMQKRRRVNSSRSSSGSKMSTMKTSGGRSKREGTKTRMTKEPIGSGATILSTILSRGLSARWMCS